MLKPFNRCILIITILGNLLRKNVIIGQRLRGYGVSIPVTIRGQFSTDKVLILWKSIINLFKNAYINITLFFKCFPQCCYKLDVICGISVKNGVLICGIIDSFYSDLSERIITRTPVNCQPLVYIMWGRLQNLTDNEKSLIMSLK